MITKQHLTPAANALLFSAVCSLWLPEVGADLVGHWALDDGLDDSNSSGDINITDGIFILSFLFGGGEGPGCEDAADADDGGTVNITDGVFLLNFLFGGQTAPPAPHEMCGPDPTPDAIGCGTEPEACAG